ncbi:MAG: hypothetical protein QXZ31_03705 [Thermofilaceae archaeon]
MKAYPIDVKVKEIRYIRGVRREDVEKIVRDIMVRKMFLKMKIWRRRIGVVTRANYRAGLVVFLANTPDGKEIEGWNFNVNGVEIRITPPLKLPRELIVYYNSVDREAFEAVVEVKPLPVVELVGKLWSGATGSDAERLVKVYVEMRRRGSPMPARWIGKLVGAREGDIEKAEEAIKAGKLFTIQPENLSVNKALST